MRSGDVLLKWRRGNEHSALASPFDLLQIETEQGSRGFVVIRGTHRGSAFKWKLGSDTWGIGTRPCLRSELLDLFIQGKYLADQKKFQRAAERWRVAALEIQPSDPPWLRSWFFVRIANLLVTAGESSQAEEAFGQALQNVPPEATAVRAQVLLYWAYAAENLDRLSEADQLYKDMLSEWRKLGTQTMVVADGLLRMGRLDLRRGDFEPAADHLRGALELSTKLTKDSLMTAISLGNLGVMEHQQGDLGRAEVYYLRSLKIEQKLVPHSQSRSLTLSNLGDLACDRRDETRATEYFARALAISEAHNLSSLDTAAILGAYGECELEFGHLARAEGYQLRALKIRRQDDATSLATAFSLKELGKIETARQHLNEAESYYREALAIAERITPRPPELREFLLYFAELLYDRADFGASETLLLRALEQCHSASLEIEGCAQTYADLARISRKRNDLDQAAGYMSQALRIIEAETARLGGSDDSRSEFRAKHNRYYSDYIDILIAQQKPELAFQVLEQSRARGLLDSLTSFGLDIRLGAAADLVMRERRLMAALRAKRERYLRLLADGSTSDRQQLETEIAHVSTEHAEVMGLIRTTSSAYAALTQAQVIPVGELQRDYLDRDTVLLTYSLGTERSYVFAVTPDSIHTYSLGPKRILEKAALHLYRTLTSEQNTEGPPPTGSRMQQGGATQAIADLSRMILAPLCSEIKGKRLAIVSDGALAYVPFAALFDPNDNGPVPLVVNHEIINLPTASILPWLKTEHEKQEKSGRFVAVLADPVFHQNDPRVRVAGMRQESTLRQGDASRTYESPVKVTNIRRALADVGLFRSGNPQLPRLIFSRLEAHEIIALTPRGKGMEATDFHANKRTALTALRSDFQVVHFATHALLDNKHPELSGLIFSLVDDQGRPQEGFMGLQDVYNTRSTAKLVVLSACQTGLGKQTNGEGMIGLVRAFMQAGSPGVIASLWKVSDLESANQMKLFYKAMEKDGMSPAAALRSAQLKMRKEKRWASPYYWAAFQIYGH